jgi:glutamate transport system substrate-binding protein
MKKTGFGVALASLAIALVAGCGMSSSGASASGGANGKFEAGTTMERLSSAGKITVGTKFDQPLFGLKGLSGKPEGFDVEIAKIIAGDLGIDASKIDWVETPSKVREEKLEQGAVDLVVATYTINDERKKRVTFAGPYYTAGQDLMVKSDNSAIVGPESLRSARAKVCSVTGSTPAEKIKQYIDASQLVLFDVYSKCADALRTGQVDAVTTDDAVLLGLVENGKGQFKLVGKPFTQEPYGIGVKKSDIAFCEFVNSSLQKASQDGRYLQAWQKSAGKVAKTSPQLPVLAACS